MSGEKPCWWACYITTYVRTIGDVCRWRREKKKKKKKKEVQVQWSGGRVGSEEVKVMVVDSELLQPWICSKMKVDHLLMVTSVWLCPEVPLHLVCRQAKRTKRDLASSALFVAFFFSATAAFPLVIATIILIHIHRNVCGVNLIFTIIFMVIHQASG